MVSVGAAAAAVLAAFLVSLIHQAARFVAAHLENVRNGALRQSLEAADREAEHLSLTFVTALNQSAVNGLKQTGGWTPEVAAEMKSHTVELLRGGLSKDAMRALSAGREDLDGLFNAYVEHAVALAPNHVAASPVREELHWPPAS